MWSSPEGWIPLKTRAMGPQPMVGGEGPQGARTQRLSRCRGGCRGARCGPPAGTHSAAAGRVDGEGAARLRHVGRPRDGGADRGSAHGAGARLDRHGRGAHARRRERERRRVDRGPARRHDELCTRLPAVRGVDRVRGAWRAVRGGGARRRARPQLPRRAGRRRLGGRGAAARFDGDRPATGAGRDRIPVQEPGAAAAVPGAVRGRDGRHQRHPPCRLGRARPGGRGGGPFRRVLGAHASAVGRGGGSGVGARGGRRRDDARGRRGRAAPRLDRGGESRAAPLVDRPSEERLMPAPLVECVPNFSEGRSRETIAALEAELAAVPGVALLDVQADAAHNRSVFTLVAPPDAALEAAFRAMRVARDRIDLTRHRGEHPRMGATDVVPFVPVRAVTMADCVTLARRLGERAGAELGIPVYLYARAATRPERERLPDIRKGEFEGLRERIGTDPEADPDFGPRRIHPTAGATAIGARPFLVAYNIYFDTVDLAVAKEIAKRIRTSSGGLPALPANWVSLAGTAHAAMELLDVDVTPPVTVFAAVEREATQRGIAILRSEIVGLVPERAILGASAACLKLADPADHLLEAKIRAAEGPTLDGWLDRLARAPPGPGGGRAP